MNVMSGTSTLLKSVPTGVSLDAPSDAVNRAILAVIHTGVLRRGETRAHRTALKDKARLFVDFDHFSCLCVNDLRDAFDEDREVRSRMAKNRRLTWLAMGRCYAQHAGIGKVIRIVALDRQGNYACELADKAVKDDWQKLVRLAEQYGIEEPDLQALRSDGQARPFDKSKRAITPAAMARSDLVAIRPLSLVRGMMA